VRDITFRRHLSHEPMVVSAFLADLRNDSKWRSEVVQVAVVSGEPGNAPTEYREQLTWEGMKAEAILTVTELDDGSCVRIVANDPGYDSTSEYRFVGVEGGTDLTLAVSLETCGALVLIEPFMWALVTRWLERDLDLLDGVLSSA